jgi:hypothetical protein
MQTDLLEQERAASKERTAALESDKQRLQEDIEFQDAEMASLKEAVATQVDELVRLISADACIVSGILVCLLRAELHVLL